MSTSETTIAEIRALTDLPEPKSPEQMTEIYKKVANLDHYYFMHYPKFRAAIIQCIRRNYWCKEPNFQESCTILADKIIESYDKADEMPFNSDAFIEHPQDDELYSYLLDLDTDLMSIVSFVSIVTISDESSDESSSETETTYERNNTL